MNTARRIPIGLGNAVSKLHVSDRRSKVVVVADPHVEDAAGVLAV